LLKLLAWVVCSVSLAWLVPSGLYFQGRQTLSISVQWRLGQTLHLNGTKVAIL